MRDFKLIRLSLEDLDLLARGDLIVYNPKNFNDLYLLSDCHYHFWRRSLSTETRKEGFFLIEEFPNGRLFAFFDFCRLVKIIY